MEGQSREERDKYIIPGSLAELVKSRTCEHAYLESDVKVLHLLPEPADGLLVTHHVQAAPHLALGDRHALRAQLLALVVFVEHLQLGGARSGPAAAAALPLHCDRHHVPPHPGPLLLVLQKLVAQHRRPARGAEDLAQPVGQGVVPPLLMPSPPQTTAPLRAKTTQLSEMALLPQPVRQIYL